MLYGCDAIWWQNAKGAPAFKGIKISQDQTAEMRGWNIRKVSVERAHDRLLIGQFGTLGWGGNSGFHALNLAVQFGANPIILVGYDMRLDAGVHWHGPHAKGLNNPTSGNVARWRRAVDGAAPMLEAMGVTVINASPISALTAYPKMDLGAALAC